MNDIPQRVLAYWQRIFAGCRPGSREEFVCSVNGTLDPKRPVMILERSDGPVSAVIHPAVAERAGVDSIVSFSLDGLKARLAGANMVLHAPDYLFYRSDEHRENGKADGAIQTRPLTAEDRAMFEAFLAEASEQDKEDAWVELDHWAVFGGFDHARLVSAASACRWTDSPVADLGVLTLSDARGRGFARAVVQAIGGFVCEQGYEPQYRCQIDNHASVGLAKSCGLKLFGSWVVAAEQGDV